MAATRRIGEVFVERGFVSAQELEAALEVQRETGERVGEILVAQGRLSRLDLASALSEHWDVREQLVAGPAPVLPVGEVLAAADGSATEMRLRGLEAVASQLESNETGEMLLRLESEIASLSDRHATDLRKSSAAQDRLRDELERQQRLEEAIHAQLEQVRAQLAELSQQVRAFASQPPTTARTSDSPSDETRPKKKKKKHRPH